MKKLIGILFLFAAPLLSQTAPLSGFCYRGGIPAKVSGMSSTNYMQGIIPSCTVTVYLTGTQTKATIYADGSNTPLGNPFTAGSATSSAPGSWLFYAATNQGYDVVLSGGISPNTYPSPITITSQIPGAGGGCVNGGSISQGCTGATTAPGAFASITGGTQTGSGSSQVNTFPGTVAAGTLIPTVLPTAGFNNVSCFGDSICQGGQGNTGISQISALGSLSGRTPYDFGVGGQTTPQIETRLNAIPSQQLLTTGFILPASGGGSATCTFPSGYEPAYNYTGSNGSSYPGAGIPITFSVSGTTYTAYVLDNGSHSYTCAPPTTGQASVTVPINTSYAPLILDNVLNGCVLLVSGRNDVKTNQSVIVPGLQNMVAAISPSTSCYMVETILNGQGEGTGTSTYTNVTATNASILTTFGAHALDVRTNMVAQYNPANGADIYDHGLDIPPLSLLADDADGALTSAITSTTQQAFSVSVTQYVGSTLYMPGGELIQITGFSGGGNSGTSVTSCIRGFGGTTPLTYGNTTAFNGIDQLHPGQNAFSPSNPNFSNGYQAIASYLYSNWVALAGGPAWGQGTVNKMIAGYIANNLQPIALKNTNSAAIYDAASSSHGFGFSADHRLEMFGGTSLICNLNNPTCDIGDPGGQYSFRSGYFTTSVNTPFIGGMTSGINVGNVANLPIWKALAGTPAEWDTVGSWIISSVSGARLGLLGSPWHQLYLESTGALTFTDATHTYSLSILQPTITQNANITIPDVTGTLAFANVSQTFTANQTIGPGNTATSSNNYNSFSLGYAASIWNGSAAAADTWTWSNQVGVSGANPTTALTLSHTAGGTGAASVALPFTVVVTTLNATTAIQANGTAGATKTCTTYPTVSMGIVTGC